MSLLYTGKEEFVHFVKNRVNLAMMHTNPYPCLFTLLDGHDLFPINASVFWNQSSPKGVRNNEVPLYMLYQTYPLTCLFDYE